MIYLEVETVAKFSIIESFNQMTCTNSFLQSDYMLRWYGHVEKKDVEDWVSKCRRLRGAGVGAGLRRQERCVNSDIRKYGMQRVERFDKDKWRSCCGSNPCKHRKKDVINRLID